MIARLDAFRRFGLPLLVGASRKRFIYDVMRRCRRASVSAARSPPTLRPCATAPRSSASMTSPTPCRRCASPMSSRRHDEPCLKPCWRSGAMSATCARRSSGPSALLCDGEIVRLIARSSDYRTPPWGVVDQPPFVNLCLVVETALSPHELLERALRVERVRGRDRQHERRWGPRPVDIDILAYDDLTMDEEDLTLPHPRLFERAFVPGAARRDRPGSPDRRRQGARCAGAPRHDRYRAARPARRIRGMTDWPRRARVALLLLANRVPPGGTIHATR